MFGRIGIGEIILILAVVLLLFGPKKLPELARSLGKSMKEFKKGAQEFQEEINSDTEAEPIQPVNTVTAEEPVDKTGESAS